MNCVNSYWENLKKNIYINFSIENGWKLISEFNYGTCCGCYFEEALQIFVRSLETMKKNIVFNNLNFEINFLWLAKFE